MQHASRLAEGVAGYVEENGLGVSNDRFGFKQFLGREQGQVAGSAGAGNRAQRVHEHLEILFAVNKGT